MMAPTTPTGYRLLQRRGGVAASRRHGNRDVEGLAADLRRPSRHVAQPLDRAAHLEHARDLQALAVFEAFELRQRLALRLDQIGEAEDQPFAIGRTQPRPRSGQRRARRDHGLVDFRGAAIRDLRDDLACGGIVDAQAPRRRRVDEGAADEGALPVGEKRRDGRVRSRR
jgi:hypothetical protein